MDLDRANLSEWRCDVADSVRLSGTTHPNYKIAVGPISSRSANTTYHAGTVPTPKNIERWIICPSNSQTRFDFQSAHPRRNNLVTSLSSPPHHHNCHHTINEQNWKDIDSHEFTDRGDSHPCAAAIHRPPKAGNRPVRVPHARDFTSRAPVFSFGPHKRLRLLRSIGTYNNGGGDIDRAANTTTIATGTTVFAPPHIREQPIELARVPSPTRTEGVEETQVSSISDVTTSATTYENRTTMHGMTASTVRMESPPVASTPAITAGVMLVGYNGADCGFACTAAQRTFTQAVSTRGSSTSTFRLTGYPQASHVLDALRKHEIDFAFVATDLLLSNTHHAALNQMVAFRLKMVGEVVAEEDVNVCALPGTELCDADSVVSDWRTLQRYEEYIVQLEMQYNRMIYRQVVWDSSAGCQHVKEEEAEKTLVLCTASAAVNHGLVVLQGRLPGSPTHTRYTIIGRYGTSSLEFGGAPTSFLSSARCTLLVKGTARAILDIISAFAFRGLEILSFHTRDDEEQHLYGMDHRPAAYANWPVLMSCPFRRSYVISYRASANPLVELGLQRHLGAASERVITLGDFTTYSLNVAN